MVRRFRSEPRPVTLENIRALRLRWTVDEDPAARAAADHIVANLISDELLALNDIAQS